VLLVMGDSQCQKIGYPFMFGRQERQRFAVARPFILKSFSLVEYVHGMGYWERLGDIGCKTRWWLDARVL
jgi:hypothetical protein